MISVCMSTFNGDKFLVSQIESVLQQIGLTDEIILVDDASTDETQKIIDRYALDPRIKSFKNRSNIGVVASFEKAILESSGSIIFLCDQDDIWLPNKVKHMSKCFEDTNVVAAVSDCELIDDVGNKISNSYFKIRGSAPGFFKNIFRNSFLGCAMAFRSSLKSKILPFPCGLPMHDEWIGLNATLSGDVVFVSEILFQYRRHGRNVTKMTPGSPFFILKKRLFYLRHLKFLKLIGKLVKLHLIS